VNNKGCKAACHKGVDLNRRDGLSRCEASWDATSPNC